MTIFKRAAALVFAAFTSALIPAFAARGNSFAIVVDSQSYSKCKTSIDAYCQAINNEGLHAFVAAQNWENPSILRDSLIAWHSSKKMEGAVFIGDIPIPMVREAQFLTTAFKMDEKMDRRDSSVPSDRFYDDFDLHFEFVGQDENETLFFYYNLSEKGEQIINCDIYTARIKPSGFWEDRYTELDNYLRKVVAVKAEKDNYFDTIASFTGEGSFSNSMIAWVDETQTLREQVPDAFKTNDGASFSTFYQKPIMKYDLLQQACREDLDLFLFHCHGTPERQWIGGYIEADYFSDPNAEAETWEDYVTLGVQAQIDAAKYRARSYYRRYLRSNSKEKAIQKMWDNFGIDSTWFIDAVCPEVAKKDSLTELETGIVLSDIQKYNTSARITLFDACYNGDFREDDCIALRYIMGHGKTVVGLGNSVNVLQDKYSSPLLGMLTAGYNVGEWQKQVNILESHIIGDPTFHFATHTAPQDLPDLANTSIDYWKKVLSERVESDLKALALQKIVDLRAPDAPEMLHKAFMTSPDYTTRLQAMLLSLRYDSPLTKEILVKSLDDPFEFIRRKGGHYLCLYGDDTTIDAIISAYMLDYNAKRIQFNLLSGASMFEGNTFMTKFEQAIEKADWIWNKDLFRADAAKSIQYSANFSEQCREALEQRGKVNYGRLYLSSLRNNPYPFLADTIIDVIMDSETDEDLRVKVAEHLGWYTYAHNRASIIMRLKNGLSSIDSPAVARETEKTIKRLEAYTL